LRTRAFLLGLVAGGLAGILLVEFGIGLPFLALAAVTVGLAIRPRPMGAAGTLIGAGGALIAILANAARACTIDQDCGSSVPDLTPWIATGVALVAAGLMALILASRHGEG
jgi:hypothetical protein